MQASYIRLGNAIDALGLSFTKLANASKAHNTDRSQYEELRKKSGQESEAVSAERERGRFSQSRAAFACVFVRRSVVPVLTTPRLPPLQINERIERKKVELEEAKKVKEFYTECEQLKEDIVQIPSCTKLNKSIDETKKETGGIQSQVRKMDALNEVTFRSLSLWFLP